MGTEKRQRQKEGRQARIAAAEQARRKAESRRRMITIAGFAVAAVVLVLAIQWFTKKDSSSTATADSSTTTTAALESAAGKPCVALADPLPPGSPPVAIQEGPPPTALVSQDIKVGDGATVAEGDTITVNYTGASCSTGKIFDSTYTRGQPATMQLTAASGLIPGWLQGIPGMKVGGQRLLGIPSELAYGTGGQPPVIAPDEALWFVVEVTETQPAAATTTTATGTAPSTTLAPGATPSTTVPPGAAPSSTGTSVGP